MATDTTTTAAEALADSALLEGETWEAAAWLLWTSGGVKQLKQIRDAIKANYPDTPVQTRSIRAGIERMSRAVHTAEAGGLLNANSEYIASLEAALQEAWKVYRTGDNDNARIAALKLVVDLLEKIAAAKGVVTQRARQELTGAGGGPVQAQIVGVAEVLNNDRAIEAACNLEAALATFGYPDPGGAGAGTDEPPVAAPATS